MRSTLLILSLADILLLAGWATQPAPPAMVIATATVVEAACGLSFADGHAEIKNWKDTALHGPPTTKLGVHDILWPQERSTARV